jgi:hypothetical protein
LLQSIGGGCVEYVNHENGLKYNNPNPGSGISQWCNNQGNLLKGILFLNYSLKSSRLNLAEPVVKSKTFPESWDSKATSVGTLLAYLETGLNHIFF